MVDVYVLSTHDICRYMQIHAGICRYVQTADICRYMQIYADICRYMQIYPDINLSLLIYLHWHYTATNRILYGMRCAVVLRQRTGHSTVKPRVAEVGLFADGAAVSQPAGTGMPCRCHGTRSFMSSFIDRTSCCLHEMPYLT